MKPEPVYKILATAIRARSNCEASVNTRCAGPWLWFENWTSRIRDIEKHILPSGSGIDNGTQVDLDKSTGEKIVLVTSFHHMDEHGGYDGWTEHTVTIRPSLLFDFDITISGRDRNEIKEYLGDVFYESMRTMLVWDDEKEGYRIASVNVNPGDNPVDIADRLIGLNDEQATQSQIP